MTLLGYLATTLASLSPKEREAVELLVAGGNRQIAREAANSARWNQDFETPGTHVYRRTQAIIAAQPVWEKLEGEWIFRSPGRSVIAVPVTGKRNAADFIVLDLLNQNHRAPLRKSEVHTWHRGPLEKSEVRNWLVVEALGHAGVYSR